LSMMPLTAGAASFPASILGGKPIETVFSICEAAAQNGVCRSQVAHPAPPLYHQERRLLNQEC